MVGQSDGSKQSQKKAASLIESVVNDRASMDEVGKAWPKDDSDDLATAFHALTHFVIDADLRRRDSEYDTAQRRLLEDVADRLRNGVPLDNELSGFLRPRVVSSLWLAPISACKKILASLFSRE